MPKFFDRLISFNYNNKTIFESLSKRMNQIYQHPTVTIPKEHLSRYSVETSTFHTSEYHKTVFEFFFFVFQN